MCLITDHEVKMTAGKQLLPLNLYRIYTVHHRLISGKNTVRVIIIFLFTQICYGKGSVIIDKRSFRLRHERCSVCKKKNIPDPSGIKKYMAQFDYRSGLTGTRSCQVCDTNFVIFILN